MVYAFTSTSPPIILAILRWGATISTTTLMVGTFGWLNDPPNLEGRICSFINIYNKKYRGRNLRPLHEIILQKVDILQYQKIQCKESKLYELHIYDQLQQKPMHQSILLENDNIQHVAHEPTKTAQL